MGKYRTIVADPPWPYRTARALPRGLTKTGRRESGTGATDYYKLMSMDDLYGLPVRELAEDDAHLYLWTTNSFMSQAHELAGAWGFDVKTICTWGKVQQDGCRPSMKTGHWFRGATEHCLFAVRGHLRLANTMGYPTLWLWPRLPHSVKPGAFYDLVQQVSPAPRLELFARTQRLGWDTWGNEALCHVTVDGTPSA